MPRRGTVLLILAASPLVLFVAGCWSLYAYGAGLLPDGIEPTARRYPALARDIYWASLGGRPPVRVEATGPVREGWRIATLIAGGRHDPIDRPPAHRQVLVIASRQWLACSLAPSTRRSQSQHHVMEFALAIRMSRWSPEQVLDSVLATGGFGRGTTGLDAAAQAWFRVPAERLSPHQMAVLALLSRSPSYFDPGCRPERFLDRYARLLRTVGLAPDPDASRAFADGFPSCAR